MKTTFISTPAIANATRLSLMRMQNDMTELNTELSTGRHADVGLHLGHRTGRTVSLRSEHALLNQLTDTNSLVQSRLETTQIALGGLTERAQGFVDITIASRDGWTGPHVGVADARDALSMFAAQLNSSIDGEFVFAGINSDVAPMEDYFGTPASAAKQAVDAAFLAEFGINQSDPAVANITAADMTTFVDGAFAALFDDPAWGATWSSASDQDVSSRISPDTVIETGTNANISPFRKLAMAFTMMADLGGETLNDQAFKVLTDKAAVIASQGIHELALAQGDVGVDQQRIERADRIMSLQLDTLNEAIINLEAVDPYETSTRLNQLISQLEVSYAVTGRLQQLSLVRYI
ncbi:MAG: flagellar hook-associated family protein [Rhizobiales bacterium]|nr:flagellar hook-associated family protein [Hyphomicrobiales bacterium]